METIILVIHLVIVIAMIGAILIQKSGSDGLSGLAGASGGNALFSVRGKSNFLTKITSILAIAFIFTSLTLAYLAAHKSGYSLVDQISPEKVNSSDVTKKAADKKAQPSETTATPTVDKKTEEPAPQVPIAK